MAAMASLTQKEHLSKWVIRASENETELMVNKANVSLLSFPTTAEGCLVLTHELGHEPNPFSV